MKSPSLKAMATRKSSAPSLDSPPRGTRWVVAQILLGVSWLVVPRLEGPWPDALVMVGLVAGISAAAVGFVILVLGFVSLGRSFTVFPRPPADGGLVITGVYRFVRNPMYDGVILVALGLGAATGSLERIIVGVIAAFF